MKKTKLKIAVFLLAAALAAGMSGCGSKSAGSTSGSSQESSAKESSAKAEEGTKQQNETLPDASEEHVSENEEKKKDTKTEKYLKKPNPAAKDGDRILFVGNSHTYVNDLPGMFAELAFAGGHNVDVYDWTEGYYTLKGFADPEDEMGSVLIDSLQNEPWDFVFLQENTNAAVSKAETEMYPSARELDGLIKNAGGQTGFLMTWSPEAGAGALKKEIVQKILSDNYTEISKELDALLIPGGDIFMDALVQDSELELWGEDGQHPSIAGTYLAACAAYTVIFQETPVGNTYIDELDKDTAVKLQTIAQNYILTEE